MLPEGDSVPYGNSGGAPHLWKLVLLFFIGIVALFGGAALLSSTGVLLWQIVGAILGVLGLIGVLVLFKIIEASGGDAGVFEDEA
jgi:hypothetical protein